MTIQTEDTESVCDLCVGVKVFHAAPRMHRGREHAALCVFILSLRYKCVFVLAERIEGVLCGDCPSSVPVSYLRQWCERRQLCRGALQASRVTYATVLPGRWQKCIFGHVSTGWCIVRGWKTLQRQKIAPLASEIGVISLSESELFRGVLSAVNI